MLSLKPPRHTPTLRNPVVHFVAFTVRTYPGATVAKSWLSQTCQAANERIINLSISLLTRETLPASFVAGDVAEPRRHHPCRRR